MQKIISWFFTSILLMSYALASAESGRIFGVLKDQKGGAVQRGSITIRSIESDAKLTTVTDNEGRYSFESLPAGRYQVSAAFPGFHTALKNEILLSSQQNLNVDFLLIVAPKETMVVITAPATMKPLTVETNPRAPRQPLPAHDGADYLKTIPGFSSIRKGGTDGDPTFRGMAGSRLNILLDGQHILGGCGGRMDPPTAYAYPGVYKRITVLKGPQSVLYGAGASAATVLFERERKRAEKPEIRIESSGMTGSYGRHDEFLDMRAAIPNGYVQAIATRSHMDDYRDGNNAAVHSFYTRWSADAEIGWTPAENAYLEFSMARSNGRAAYADRAMDGTKFARDNISAKFDQTFSFHSLKRLQAQVFYNYVDHVMDNFSLRTPGTMYSSNNPDRRTAGVRAAATLELGGLSTVVIGMDAERNVHGLRTASGSSAGKIAAAFFSAPKIQDMRFSQIGIFGEATRLLTLRSRLVGGFRTDWHEATDSRMCVNASACSGNSPLKNNTKGATDHKTLLSGFGRYELDIRGGSTIYAGIGHAERSPDYWERLKQDPVALRSAFLTTKPEKTTQLDFGMIWNSRSWSGSLSAFYGRVQDYILMRWNPAPILTRNINATTAGWEADANYRISDRWTLDAAVSYVRAENDTDSKPLAQQPPFETRVGLNYEDRNLSFGLLARLAGAQDRIDIGSGNIVANGMDIGRTGGFAVFSLNGGYRLRRILLVTGGIDNILDRAYAEHLSKSGAYVAGFAPMSRVNEPGRTLWLKANFSLE